MECGLWFGTSQFAVSMARAMRLVYCLRPIQVSLGTGTRCSQPITKAFAIGAIILLYALSVAPPFDTLPSLGTLFHHKRYFALEFQFIWRPRSKNSTPSHTLARAHQSRPSHLHHSQSLPSITTAAPWACMTVLDRLSARPDRLPDLSIRLVPWVPCPSKSPSRSPVKAVITVRTFARRQETAPIYARFIAAHGFRFR